MNTSFDHSSLIMKFIYLLFCLANIAWAALDNDMTDDYPYRKYSFIIIFSQSNSLF